MNEFCDFEPTGETHRFGAVLRCVHCKRKAYGRAVQARCGVANRPTWEPCANRGDVVGTIVDCGCGGGGPLVIAVCSVHGHCVPRGIGARAKYREFTTKKPTSCALCKAVRLGWVAVVN